jgi:hypothetical protein
LQIHVNFDTIIYCQQWSRGLLLVELPPRVAGHTYDGDEATTKTRKAKAGEGVSRTAIRVP